MTTKEYFPGIGKIPFEGKESKNPMAFHYYNAEKVIRGKKMKDWLRFSMAWWHTLCAEGGDQFGGGTKRFPWNVASSPIQRAKDKMDAGFEFMQKCGIGYYCFHDIDLVEEADTIEAYEATREVELDNEINSPEVYNDPQLLREKSDELADLRFHQEELFAAWEKAMEEQEQYEQGAAEE